MTPRESMPTARRTLLIGLGPTGLAIAQAFQRRLAQRALAQKQIAVTAIAPVADNDGTVAAALDHVPVAWVSDVGQDATRRDARRATLASGPAITGALVDGLISISRLQPADSTFGLARPMAEEIDVFIVTSLDDPLGGSAYLDVAYLVRYLARQRLNAPTRLGGMLLLPDPLVAADPRPAMARSYAALRELEVTLAPHDGHVTCWGEQLIVDGQGPSFDNGCYLLAAFNQQGLAFAQPEERIELAAEALFQLAVVNLTRHCDLPMSSYWSADAPARAYASLGLAAWVYPADSLLDHAAHRLADDILNAWRWPAEDQRTSLPLIAPDGFWQRMGGDSLAIAQSVLPAERLQSARLWRPLSSALSLTQPGDFKRNLDEEMALRLETLMVQRPSMDHQAQALGAVLAGHAATGVTAILDAPVPGRLPEAQDFVAGIEHDLKRLRQEVDRDAAAQWERLEIVERDLEHAGLKMDTLADQLPKPAGRAVLSLLLRPRRLLAALTTAQTLQRAGATYAALLAKQTATALEVLRSDLVLAAYAAAEEGLAQQSRRVESLTSAAEAALERVRPIPYPRFGTLGFALERSVLTPEMVDAMVTSARGDIADLLAEIAASSDALSAWPGADPDGEDLAGVALDIARRRCSPIRQTTVADLLLQTLPGPQARKDALHALTEAASQFLAWDESQLRSIEYGVLYTCSVVGMDDGAASSLLADLGELLFAQVVASHDRQRITAMGLVHCLPLAAVGGIDECAAAYRDGDPASLHDPDGWPMFLEVAADENRFDALENPDNQEEMTHVQPE